ncbi:MAG: MauE/DoxX family redox-associated membrane protein [Pyrinomonadaceae bacterium]
MTRRKLFRIIFHVCRFGLAALFLFTAGAKLWIITEFVGKVAELLSSMKFNYERWQWPATIAVIVLEIVIAALLIVPKTVRLGALAAGLLLVGFSAFALYYTYGLQGEALECGCFGNIIGSQLGVKTALRNLGFLVPALIVFFGAPKIWPQKGTESTKEELAGSPTAD